MVQVGAGSRALNNVGEFGVIRGLSNLLRSSKVHSAGVEIGLGDDAAVWKPRRNHSVVVTTDMLVEGVHFRHDWSKPEEVGHRALAVNLSDIAAMGGRPRVAVVSIGLRGTETDRWVYDFYRGAMKLGDRYKFQIIGGDLTKSPQQTMVSVTLHGEIPPRQSPMRRDAAQPGDIIAVTGPLGMAAGGVRVLTEDSKVDGSPRMIETHRKPEPRIVQGVLLRRLGVRCAMDLSDGLLGDLPKICDASGMTATLEQDRLPIPHAVRWGFPDWFDLALRGGEDFELLFTCAPELFELVEHTFQRQGCPPPIRIGTISEPKEEPEVRLLRTDRKQEPLEPGAFDHFALPSEA